MGEVIFLSERTVDRSGTAPSRLRAARSRSRSRAGGGSSPSNGFKQPLLFPTPSGSAGIARHRRQQAAPPAASAAFFFELGCPISYLAAERVERTLGQVAWVPMARLDVARGRDPLALAELLAFATAEADNLRLPLIVPDGFGGEQLPAWRAAAYASSQGAGGRFALAASRLAFCGGFDLCRRETLTEAAAAAGIEPSGCVEAMDDPRWDLQLFATARGLAGRGVTASPAIRVGRSWFYGHDAVREAGSFAAMAARRPAEAKFTA
jgi:2-hydroxychromene-2-carboxylate isomerase